jgi:hypothetical protein
MFDKVLRTVNILLVVTASAVSVPEATPRL